MWMLTKQHSDRHQLYKSGDGFVPFDHNIHSRSRHLLLGSGTLGWLTTQSNHQVGESDSTPIEEHRLHRVTHFYSVKTAKKEKVLSNARGDVQEKIVSTFCVPGNSTARTMHQIEYHARKLQPLSSHHSRYRWDSSF